MTDPIAFVEAAYVDAPSEAEWIQGVAQAARSLLPEAAGVLAFVHETHDADWVSVGAASAIGFDPRLLGALMNAPIERGEESRAMVQNFVGPRRRRRLPSYRGRRRSYARSSRKGCKRRGCATRASSTRRIDPASAWFSSRPRAPWCDGRHTKSGDGPSLPHTPPRAFASIVSFAVSPRG